MSRRTLAIVAVVAAIAGCAYQPAITLSGGARAINRGDAGLVGCLAWTQRWSDRAAFELEHCSNPARGSPFNDRYDVSQDKASVKYSWGGKRR